MEKITIVSGGNSIFSRLTGVLNYTNVQINEANQKVEKSDGVILLTPVYKASYTGILKTYIDLLPQKGLKDKTVLPLVLGGTFGHLLVIDYALKPVLSNLGAANILSGAFIIDTQVTKLQENRYLLDEESQNRLEHVLDDFIHSVGGVKI
ncbi:NAD(P)H-dependent oxidoreductase [Niallia sp. 03133]|uniref:NAD(P)H-dependent oxidoreductase n=1 Tax=Niallia sp. 03133 TaxID=3458060 RepID=UPI004044A9BA